MRNTSLHTGYQSKTDPRGSSAFKKDACHANMGTSVWILDTHVLHGEGLQSHHEEVKTGTFPALASKPSQISEPQVP